MGIEVKISGRIFNTNVPLHIEGIHIMPSIVEFNFTRYYDDNFTYAWHSSIFLGSTHNASKPFFGMEFDSIHWGFDNQTTMVARHVLKPGDTWHIKMVIYSNYTYDVYVNGTLFLKYNTGLSTLYKPTTSELIWTLPLKTENGETLSFWVKKGKVYLIEPVIIDEFEGDSMIPMLVISLLAIVISFTAKKNN